MPVNDELGKRMKEYEEVSRIFLERKVPVALRLDGKAFHTFTKGFQKPFDDILIETMQDTMKYLCENIQGCVLGYTQSDEITLILIDYQNENTEAWFNYRVDKMCSIAAAMATMEFNRRFLANSIVFTAEKMEKVRLLQVYQKAIDKGAIFDCRAFNIPKEEVANLLYWRQKDAERNSIQMLGQAHFSHKELQNKCTAHIIGMLYEKGKIKWTDLPTTKQRGSCCTKKQVEQECLVPSKDFGDFKSTVLRNKWIIDNEIPRFVEEGREYIEKLINF